MAEILNQWVVEGFEVDGWRGEHVPDIAFVQVGMNGLAALELAGEAGVAPIGTSVATLGFPLGAVPLTVHGRQTVPMLRRGIVSSAYPFNVPQPHGLTIDISQQPGASGSPVFLDDTPKVIGMVHSISPGTNLTFVTPSWLIKRALASALEEKPISVVKADSARKLFSRDDVAPEPPWSPITFPNTWWLRGRR